MSNFNLQKTLISIDPTDGASVAWMPVTKYGEPAGVSQLKPIAAMVFPMAV